MRYTFAIVPPAGWSTPTGIDIYECKGGASEYVVKHDTVHDTVTCSCPDATFRRGNRSRERHECKHARAFRQDLDVRRVGETGPAGDHAGPAVEADHPADAAF